MLAIAGFLCFSNLSNTPLYYIHHIFHIYSPSVHHSDRLFSHLGFCANVTVDVEVWFYFFDIMRSFILGSCLDRFVRAYVCSIFGFGVCCMYIVFM